MFCPSCGTDLPDQSKFCGSCGFQMPADAAPAVPAQAPPQAHTLMAPAAGLAVPAPAGPVPHVDDVIARGVELPIGESLSAAWDLLKPQLGLAIGGMLVLGLIGSFAANTLIGLFVLAPVYAGFDIFCLRLVGGRPVAFENFFDGFKRFVPFMILGLIRFGLIFGGSLLLVLPGIYLAIATSWAWYLHIDRGLEPWEAIKTSMRIVNSSFFGHLGFLFVMGLIAGVGSLACYVGMLVTAPLASVAIAWAYKHNFGLQGGAENH